MPDPRLDNGEEVDDEEEDEEVSDNPLPAWLEGDSLAPPCQVSLTPCKAPKPHPTLILGISPEHGFPAAKAL